MPSIADVATYLDRFAPPALAAEWDNTGLLVGDILDPADRILLCLTLTPDVAAEALANQAQLIVSHHPVLFRGAKKLTRATADGRILVPLLRAGVAVYSPHTSFDNCPGGINDGLAIRLGLTNLRPLRLKVRDRECKLVVFVPDADLSRVSEAVFAAGAGRIGQYEQCSYRLAGTGTFFGTDETNPTIGQKGRREEVSEWRLEVVVPEGIIDQVIAAMKRAHSYEEPAFDVYLLRPNSTGGEGRIGELTEPVTLVELAHKVKASLSAQCVQVVGDFARSATRVAVACGAAGEFLTEAVRAQADVFLTGEMRFHECLMAAEAELGVIMPGHYATERPGIEDLARRLASNFPDSMVWTSQVEQEPIRFID